MTNWDDLRYFLALADCGTLSGAARRLRVKHTTVARRIDALEEALSLHLFDRMARGWVLTTEGQGLIRHAREVEAHWYALECAAHGAETVGGSVRISAPPTLSAFLVAPNLRTILRDLPHIDIELVGESRETNLSRREADIALRMFRPTTAGLAIKPLAAIHYSLFATPRYLKERTAPDWEFLGYDEDLSAAPQQQWLEKFADGRRFVMRSSDQTALCLAAASGLGLAVLPNYLGRQQRELTAVADEACAVKRKLWLVMHGDVRRSPRVRAVADGLIELFASDAVTQLLT